MSDFSWYYLSMLHTIDSTPCNECTERIKTVDLLLNTWREKVHEIVSGLQRDLEGGTAMPLDIRERILDIRRHRLDLRRFIDSCRQNHEEHELLARKQYTRLHFVDQMIEGALQGVGESSPSVLAQLRYVQTALKMWNERIRGEDWPQYTVERVAIPLPQHRIDQDQYAFA
jgi:hypothetical protein